MYEDEQKSEPKPPAEITKSMFRRWQKARRANVAAEDMTNPVWESLFRGRIDPYHANKQFEGTISRLLMKNAFPSAPRWAGCRMGQSRARLSDGRIIWVAGEHEDHYDPDFYIYNDVIVESPNGEIQIFGYPDSVFRPTDFHSATLIDNESHLLLVGSLGYPDDRRVGSTQIYRLNLKTMEMTEVVATGCHPGWIHSHKVSLSEDGQQLMLSGGKIFCSEGIVDNIDEWSLRLSDMCWSRLTDRQWARVRIFRSDFQMLHLWRYNTFDFYYDEATFEELTKELGVEPDLEVYKTLFRPSLPHQLVESEWAVVADIDADDSSGEDDNSDEDEDSWCTKRVVIDGVELRIVHGLSDVMITMEGDLPIAKVTAIAEELRDKLAVLENAACELKWIFPDNSQAD